MASVCWENSCSDDGKLDLKQRLILAIKNQQEKQVLQIFKNESHSFTNQIRIGAMKCAAHFKKKYIFLSLFYHDSRCREAFKKNILFLKHIDSLGPEADFRGGDMFWIFNTLYTEKEDDLALFIATVYPEEILIYQHMWPKLIEQIDLWIRFRWCLLNNRKCKSRLKKLVGEASLFHVKRWCVENEHANATLYLAVVTQDWQLVHSLAATQIWFVNGFLIFDCIEFMSNDRRRDHRRGRAAACTMLQNYPLDARSASYADLHEHGLKQTSKVCQDNTGLLDWGLYLSSDIQFIKQHYKMCQNHIVLNKVLKRFVDAKEWEHACELLPGCRNVENIKHFLYNAIHQGRLDMVRELLYRADRSCVTFDLSQALLCECLKCFRTCHPDTSHRLVRLCIELGLSTFGKLVTSLCEIGFNFNTTIPNLKIIKLLVQSGILTHVTLRQLSRAVEPMLAKGPSEEDKKCYSYILKAATNPCSLQHSARLIISHSIGCQQGRSERIQALHIPGVLKKYVRFEDVLEADADF